MVVKQISIFLENRPGRLREVARILGDNEINIRALSLADTSDFGILRLIVNDPDRANRALKENNFTVNETDVIAVEVPDRPGGLAGILTILDKEGINVEYMYAFLEKATDQALIIFRFEDNEEALRVLQENNISMLGEDQIYRL